MVLVGPGTDSLMEKSRCCCNVKKKTLIYHIFLSQPSGQFIGLLLNCREHPTLDSVLKTGQLQKMD